MADDEPPLTNAGRRVGALVALALVVLVSLRTGSGTFGAPAPEPTERVATATVPPTATATPSPTSTNTPTPTPTVTPTSTPTMTPTGPRPYEDWAVDVYGPDWNVDCLDEAIENGYEQGSWARDFCVPGLITYDSYWHDHPNQFYGLMSSYAYGVMEAQLAHRSIPEGQFKDGVALMSCAYIRETVWLRRPGYSWDGPFIVVDCSQKNHMYYHYVGMGLVVEVGFDTVERWGAAVLQYVEVHIGRSPPGGSWSGVYLPAWWVQNRLAWEPLP